MYQCPDSLVTPGMLREQEHTRGHRSSALPASSLTLQTPNQLQDDTISPLPPFPSPGQPSCIPQSPLLLFLGRENRNGAQRKSTLSPWPYGDCIISFLGSLTSSIIPKDNSEGSIQPSDMSGSRPLKPL